MSIDAAVAWRRRLGSVLVVVLTSIGLLAGSLGTAFAEQDWHGTPTQHERNSRPADSPASVNGGYGTSAKAGAAVTAGTVLGCPATYACAWIDINYGSYRGQWAGDNPDWRVFPRSGCQTGTWDRCASSFLNNGTSCDVYTLNGLNYGGGGTVWFIGDKSPNLSNQFVGNDAIRSNYWC